MGMLHTAIRPSQNLLFVHREHGVVGRELIYLTGQLVEDAEGLPFSDHQLPKVWAECYAT